MGKKLHVHFYVDLCVRLCTCTIVHIGFDQSITTTSSSSSENELGGGLSDEYEEYEEREEESVPLNTNSYLEDDTSGSITDLPKTSSVNMKKQQKLNRKVNMCTCTSTMYMYCIFYI